MQKEFRLKPRHRGFHLITEEVERHLPEIAAFSAGVLHLFIKHSSASLTLNENADPTVRDDMERFFLHAVPDDTSYFVHTYEGPDDMPAHVKSVMIGSSVQIPVTNGRLNLGTWQGIYLGEHRISASGRTIVATFIGA